jgi:putative colanic acid biosynthesis acetyltransferase WcaF
MTLDCGAQGMDLNIVGNRKAVKYSHGEMIRRFFWGVGKLFFRFSPRICFGWRRFILRLFGAKIGKEVHVYNSAIVYMPWNLEIGDWSGVGEQVYIYNLGRITIGSRATISHRAHLCAGTHDYTNPDLPLQKPPIHIMDQAWICTDAFVGPGMVVGEGAIVGARGVVVNNVSPWIIVAGNPARPIKKRVMNGRQK